MRILILANNDVGLYRFRKELIEKLLEEHEVIISLPYGPLVEPLKKMGCRFVDTPIDRRGMNPFKDIKLYLNYRKILKKESPDLVITYTVKPNIYGGYACKKANIHYCVNITGLGTTFQNEGVLKKLVVTMYRAALKKAKTVFFENAENRDIFVESKIITKEKTCVLNGAGVNLDHYQVTEYPNGDTTRFLFIGRVMKEKGVNELFEAMKRLVSDGFDVHLDVLGGYEEDYKAVIKRYENEGWLAYYGFQDDVRPFIAASHCFVLPSWHEGMANSNLECAASGRPVITSNIHGCLEAVENGESGFLCEKQNAENLYTEMRDFVAMSYDERKRLGANGRIRMEKYFDRKTIVIETISRLQ